MMKTLQRQEISPCFDSILQNANALDSLENQGHLSFSSPTNVQLESSYFPVSNNLP